MTNQQQPPEFEPNEAPSAETATKRRRSLRVLVVVALVVAAAALAVAAKTIASRGSGNGGNQPLFEVAEGPLTISVTESGTVQPRDQIVIKSEVEGTTTILYLVPEGTKVQKGDLLVQLDASNLEDSKVDQEIRAQNAEASFISARENLEVVKSQAQSDTDEAELKLRFAQEDLKNYEEGEYPNQQKELKGKVTLTEEEQKRAEDELYWSKLLSEKKYLSDLELKADQLAVDKANLDLELANSNLDLLENFTYKRTLDQRKSDVIQAKMALERTKLKASANKVQAEASKKAQESESTREKDKLTKIGQQIQKTKIVAPQNGLVVYATSAQAGRPGHNVQPLEEGQQVRERQELIYLPTGSTFKAEVSVHESNLDKIHTGLPVRITVDAIPGVAFTGKVASIAPLPDARSMFMNPDLKVYTTGISIDGGADVLRSGMTCKAEIVIEQYPSAVYVPVQSVIRVKGKTTAFVSRGDTVEPRQVEIGLDNNRMVRIVSGLKPGETVLLTPPLEASEAVTETEVGIQPKAAATEKVSGGASAAEPRAESSAPATAPVTQSQPSASEPPAAGERPSRGSLENLTPEERQRLRERFQNMSPEEREAMRARMEQRRQQAGEEGTGE